MKRLLQKISRRQFLFTTLMLGGDRLPALMRLQTSTPSADSTPEVSQDAGLDLSGAITDVHDPAIIKGEDAYYLYCTGGGIPVRKSDDLLRWERAALPIVLIGVPDWAQEMIPGATNIWAPDITYHNGKYLLYYSVSTFGSNRSVIGLATNTTLNFENDAYEWVDEGLVIASEQTDSYNCIDPNFVLDRDGITWLAFGSHWSGIKMRRLDPMSGKLSTEDERMYSLAERFVNDKSVEGAFIFTKGVFYYLFVSFDACCRGVDSTYNVRVGRSESVTGPYVDRDGVAMVDGGGTQVTFPTERWRGPGHNAIFQANDIDYIVYHAYDAKRGGNPTLRISPLTWDDDGWPSIAITSIV
jgi:arabinan endo-1,5-alpha-L-arabinosidase